ncbi:MAG TPA: hypothetical protein VHW44_02375 [Pseudonocardiaceae bacterium]|jgi:hypothetical protein|nr:hypothetical protein [Pseudonocardiaceae bacterium]
MTSQDDRRSAATRNNVDWCAAVCRTHGILGTHTDLAWTSTRRTPPYYPDAITLHPDATAADLLDKIDTATPGCSVKDSFAELDLASDGFVELFTAQWIHRPADLPAPTAPGVRAEPVRTADALRRWQAAWGESDLFRPALLADRDILILAVTDGESAIGGAVLNRGGGVVGISNLFASNNSAIDAVWSGVLGAAHRRFSGLAVVGYTHGGELAAALAAGFVTAGPLRVWLREP